jgi:carbonic anhydrase
MSAVSAIDPLIDANRAAAEQFTAGLPGSPARAVAVVTCMDARIDPVQALGLRPGDAHVIRNAGGLVTDDVLRSLAISQRKLGTTAVMVIQHTGCGLGTYRDEDFRAELTAEAGAEPPWPATSFGDSDQNVRDAVARVTGSAHLLHRDDVRGFVFDLDTGLLREVQA